MPELPEVETVVRGLRTTVIGKTIARVRSYAPPASIVVGKTVRPRSFTKALNGKTILNIDRRGKNILISLSDNLTLWVHLKMTGHFFYLDSNRKIEKHDLVIFDFEVNRSDRSKTGSHYDLRFNDYRRFGRLRLFNSDEVWCQPGLASLGPEPLSISADDFVELMSRTKRMIKPALLDQSFLAGLGNIYADEVLHYSRLHPQRLTSSLSRKKAIELHGHIQKILKKAIRMMGSSVDSYSGINGQAGKFQHYLKAYNNEGKPCQFCASKIRRMKIGSRSAHFCPRCQRL